MPPARVIASKLANALIRSAEVSNLAGRVGAVGGPAASDWARRNYGGLWVSGRVTLTASELTFVPNFLNRLVRKDAHARTIGLATVDKVEHSPGLVNGTVDVVLDDGAMFTFRCIGARDFAAKIIAAKEAAAP